MAAVVERTQVQIEQELQLATIEAIKEVAKDTRIRLGGHEKNITLLNKGVFLPNAYYTALQSHGEATAARIEAFRKKGSFYHGYGKASDFDNVPEPNSVTSFHPYGLRAKVEPLQALDTFKQGTTLTGHIEVCDYVFHRALAIVLGEEKFKALFSEFGPQRVGFSSGHSALFEALLERDQPSAPSIGQIVFFRNVFDYSKKHINGEDSGIAALCVDTEGQEKFVYLGSDPNGETAEQVADHLLEAYNADPVSIEIVPEPLRAQFTEALAEAEPKKSHTLTKREFEEMEGGERSPAVFKLNAERVTALANETLAGALLLSSTYTSVT